MDLKDHLLSKLQNEFPKLQFTDTKLITKGWDHDVLVIDNAFIVRFAKEKLDKKSFEREINFLEKFSKISNIQIPDYTLLSNDKTFGGYAMIPGEELTSTLYQKLSDEKRTDFIRDIALFVSKLHAIPLSKAKEYGFELYGSWIAEVNKKATWFEEEFYPKMTAHLTADENTFIRDFVVSFCKSQHMIHPVLGHFDLGHDHILMNPDGSISGIIDFGDISIADPANEFEGLMFYDKNLPNQIYELYTGPKDATFLSRCKDHYVHKWIYLLYDGLVRRNNMELWEEARKKLQELMKQ